MPEISIIVPNYNTAKYLPRCLDSLINQTFQDIEILVIDDGSTDDSVKIMESYQDQRIHILHHKGDGFGPGGARNMGLDQATGTYVMFCDSDDWYEPNMCQKMYETIQREKVDVVCCQNSFDYEEDLGSDEIESRAKRNYFRIPKKGKYNLSIKRIFKTSVVLWNKIWRRDLIEQYAIRFVPKNEHDDDAFWFMYASIAQTIFYIKDNLYHYFLRKNSIMSAVFNKTPKNPKDRFFISLGIFDFFNKYNLLDKNKRFLLRIFRNELNTSAKFLPKEALQEACDYLNNLIKNNLKSNNYLITGEKSVFLIQPWSKIVLWRDYIWSCFRKEIHQFFWKKKYQKYDKKVSRLKEVLKTI